MPYVMYVDVNGYPQFILADLFKIEKNTIVFNELLLTPLQINLYYAIYRMGGSVD